MFYWILKFFQSMSSIKICSSFQCQPMPWGKFSTEYIMFYLRCSQRNTFESSIHSFDVCNNVPEFFFAKESIFLILTEIVYYSWISKRLSHEEATVFYDASSNDSYNNYNNNADDNNWNENDHFDFYHWSNDIHGLHGGILPNQRNKHRVHLYSSSN